MKNRRKAPAKPDPQPKSDPVAEQVASLADRVAELEQQLASVKQSIAAHLGIAV